MNSRLLLCLIPIAGLITSGCKKSDPEAPAAPAAKPQAARPVEPPIPVPPPVPAGPTESERKLAQQLRETQTRQLELELKLEEEKLARTEADIAKEQSLLKKEREALLLEQELAAAKTAAKPAQGDVPPDDVRGNQTDYQTFYDDLSPYGSWYDSPDYGYVWQPSVSLTDNYWRPYTLGSWANCDQGWAWCSDEPFGWACYHYGRWAQIRGCGWVWVPGDQWAPCWVSWRSNDDYIGWCPMPPETVYNRDCTYGPSIDRDCGIHPGCYVFVAAKHFDRPCRNYCEAPVTCLKICASTVNITNIVIHPGHVDCHGPKVDWVTERVRRPVPRYSLARESGRVDREHRTYRTDKDKLHYYAPTVDAAWNSKLVPARHDKLASHEVVRADGGLPEKLASRYKTERMERERDAQNLKGSAKALVERQQRLAELEHSRILLREQVARQQKNAVAATAAEPAAPVGKPDRIAKPAGKGTAPRAEPVTEKPQISTNSEPRPETPALARTRDGLSNGREQIARQREQQAAAMEQQRAQAAVNSRLQTEANAKDQQDKQSMLRAQIEEKRRQQTALETVAAQQAASEQQRRAVETAARADAAAAALEMEKQNALRARIEEKRRQQQEAQSGQSKSQDLARGAAMEQPRRPSDPSSQDMDKQTAMRRQQQDVQNQNDLAAARSAAAAEQQRRSAEGEAKAEQQARQREALEQQRAAIEQQNRQAELAARAEKQQREAAEMQRRQAEAETRQRQIQEEQRRNAEEQQQRRQEAETRQQRIQDEQRRNAEAQQQRREAEDQAKAAAEQQRRQEKDNNEKDKGKR